MPSVHPLLECNRNWVRRRLEAEPDFFKRLAAAQRPNFLWIGCSDSRVPANEIVDQPPGEVFVHRNVANVVVHSDLNCLSVIQYAVEALHVEHIIVCGHYGCGGVQAVVDGEKHGLIDNWLRNVHDVRRMHADRLEGLSRDELMNRLCELNVLEQVRNVATTSVVEEAWTKGRELYVHGWIYGLHDGLLRDLGLSVSGIGQVEERYERLFA